MTETIAIAGKGGTGKTTLTGFLIDYLAKTGAGPVLAVDADANDNLNEVLGVEVEYTLGEIREEVARAEQAEKSPIPKGMNKQDYMEYKLNGALAEGDDFDMLVMGRTQGTGCYCFANSLLKNQLTKLTKSYRYIIVDNEAGMEHISRGTLPSIDKIILVSDCSRRGVQAVARIAALVNELELKPKFMKLIINRAPREQLDDAVREEVEKHGLDLLGVVPHDPAIYDYDAQGLPTSTLPSTSPSRKAFEALIPGII